MNKRLSISLVVLVSCAFAVFLSVATASPPALPNADAIPPQARAKIEPRVLKQFAEQKQATYLVYLAKEADLSATALIEEKSARRQAVVASLRETARRTQQDVIAQLHSQQAAGHVESFRSFWVFNGLAVKGDVESLLSLATRPDVAKIRANRTLQLPAPEFQPSDETVKGIIEWGVKQIGADRVWREFEVRGEGVVIASLDTGVQWTHPALRSQYRGREENHDYSWFDATGSYPTAPNDGHGHGTHTAGTLVGDDGDENQIGVAPGAEWIAVKAFRDDGTTDDVTLHTALQWILAPTRVGVSPTGTNGDPSKAPDVVNNSWGSDNIADPSFRPDVRALRAAGIFPAFSAGNNGEAGPGTVGTPGSFPEAFAVGATDPSDRLASFSGLGPSFWEEVKPDVTAPGQFVRSSFLNGEYAIASGTSMAAPHAAGAAALLLSANPDLSVTDVENFLRVTAQDLGEAGPDNEFGTGRINVYDALRWARTAGDLFGAITDATSGDPVGGAVVTGVRGGTPRDVFTTTTDADGEYNVGVPAGSYRLTVDAFGYQPQPTRSIEVLKGLSTVEDFELRPAPKAVVSGQVLEAESGDPLQATVTAPGTPASAATGSAGRFVLVLPEGSYTLRAEGAGHRAQTVEIVAEPGADLTQDFELDPAPSVLLVDGDTWVGDNVTPFYQLGLERAGFLHDTRLITDTANIPTLEELSPYDLVVWAHPGGSPGFIDFVREDAATINALSAYLDQGGRLLLSGQEIGYWDDNSLNQIREALAPDFFDDYLHAGYVQDDAGFRSLIGFPGSAFAGVELTLNDLLANKNQNFPDEIELVDTVAFPSMLYAEDSLGGVQVDTDDYRLVYFAFGLEGAGPRMELVEALARAVTWLNTPTLMKEVDKAEADPDEILTYRLTVNNPGQAPVPSVLIRDVIPENTAFVQGSATDGATYDAAADRIEWSGPVAGGGTASFSFQVRLEVPLAEGTTIENVATLEDGRGGTATATASTTVKESVMAGSTKAVARETAAPGELLSYTVTLVNDGADAVAATMIDPIPEEVEFVSGSVTGGAAYDPQENQVTWGGSLAPGETQSLQFQARIVQGVTGGVEIVNTAFIDDGLHPPLARSARTTVRAADLRTSLKVVDKARAAPGDRLTYSLFVTNTGTVTATEASVIDPIPDQGAYVPGSLQSSVGVATANESARRIEWTGAVPPTSSEEPEYDWRTSDETGGPDFDWVDISSTGTRVSLGDDDTTGALDIGFSFPFFGKGYSSFYISSNGWISFSEPDRSYPFNRSLPTISAPLNMVAPFWDDLNPSRGGEIRYERLDEETLVVSYLDVPRFAIGGPHTFQVVLKADGTITYQYGSIGDIADSATIGIQNEDATRGITVVYNELFARNGLAVQFTPPPPGAGPVSITFQVELDDQIPLETEVLNQATIEDGQGNQYIREARTTVNAVDITTSSKVVSQAIGIPGDVLTYTVTLRNTGAGDAVGVRAVDRVPFGTDFVAGSTTGGATYDSADNQVTWTGDVPAGEEIPFSFAARIKEGLRIGVNVVNTVTIDDGIHPPFLRKTSTRVDKIRLADSVKRVHKDVAVSGDVLTYTIALRNSSPVPATGVVGTDQLPAYTTLIPGSITGGATYDSATGQVKLQGMVPARGDEYVRADSDQSDGPRFDWIDISETGTRVTGVDDDSNHGSFPIGFPFPFFEQEHVRFYVSSNGFISLSPISGSNFTNDQLPDSEAPVNLVAPFWDDLNPDRGGEIRYQTIGGEMLVVSYLDVPHFGGSLGNTFQVILKADGTIIFQYQSMSPPLDEATVGIQNQDGSDAVLLAFDEPYVRDGLASRIGFSPGEWLISYRARVAEDAPLETVIENRASITDSQGNTYVRAARTALNTVHLGASTITPDRDEVVPGQPLTYRVTISNTGSARARDVTVLNSIPANTSFVSGSATDGASFDPGRNRVAWRGNVPAGGERSFAFGVVASSNLRDGMEIVNVTTIDDGVSAHEPTTRRTTTRVIAPNLSASEKRAPTMVGLSRPLRYTILVANRGGYKSEASLVDPLPPGVAFVSGSARAGVGQVRYNPETNQVVWEGTLIAHGLVQIEFQVIPGQLGALQNTVTIHDGFGVTTETGVSTQVVPNVFYLPLIQKD